MQWIRSDTGAMVAAGHVMQLKVESVTEFTEHALKNGGNGTRERWLLVAVLANGGVARLHRSLASKAAAERLQGAVAQLLVAGDAWVDVAEAEAEMRARVS